LTEDQRVLHLLNRIGFGPRPGDVERVKRMGIDKYIDRQLHPDRIDDQGMQARLAGLDSLHMSVAQVYEKYPAPNMIARELGLGRKAQANQQGAQNGQNQPGSQANDATAKQDQDAAAKLEQKENRE